MARVVQEARLVLKHTFLEFVDLEAVPDHLPFARCFTDSELVVTPSGSELATPLERSESGDAVSMSELAEIRVQDKLAGQDPCLTKTDLLSPSTSPWRGPTEWMPADDMLASGYQLQLLTPVLDESGLENFGMYNQDACVWWQMDSEMLPPFSYIVSNDMLEPIVPMEEMQQHSLHYEYEINPQEQQQLQQQQQQQFEIASDETTSVSQDKSSEGSCTTVMLRNIPNMYTRTMVRELIDSEGFTGRYDFLYMPVDFNSGVNLGYVFVDLISPADAHAFINHFTGFARWPVASEKICEVSWSNQHQGLDQHIERYRNSPVMHEIVPDEWKPMILSDGLPVHFPPPTKKLKAPKIRCRADGPLARGGSTTA